MLPKDSRAFQIRAAMLIYLGREPDLPGFISYYHSPLSIDEIREDVRRSEERRGRIQAVFHGMVGREPTADELDYWLEARLAPDRILLELAYLDERLAAVQHLQQELLGSTEGAELLAERPVPLAALRAELTALQAQWTDRDVP